MVSRFARNLYNIKKEGLARISHDFFDMNRMIWIYDTFYVQPVNRMFSSLHIKKTTLRVSRFFRSAFVSEHLRYISTASCSVPWAAKNLTDEIFGLGWILPDTTWRNKRQKSYRSHHLSEKTLNC
jgi:hypothetical protein